MWPFTDAFTRGLRKCAKCYVKRLMPESPDDKTMTSLSYNAIGFYDIHLNKLGELAGLIFAQAQLERVSRVQLHYGTNKMIYTIAGVDNEMVPLPPPSNVDLVRALAEKSRMQWNKPGMLPIQFADMKLSLIVNLMPSATDPYLEITGFTGEPSAPREETQ